MTDTREQFERHFKLNFRQKARNKDGIYRDPLTRAGWDGWLAREQLVQGAAPDEGDLATYTRADLVAYIRELEAQAEPKPAQGERQPDDRDAVLEEAAQVCMVVATASDHAERKHGAYSCAGKIRALKTIRA